jgi:hypothetical protein
MLKISHYLLEYVTKFVNFADEENSIFPAIFCFIMNTQRQDGVLTKTQAPFI